MEAENAEWLVNFRQNFFCFALVLTISVLLLIATGIFNTCLEIVVLFLRASWCFLESSVRWFFPRKCKDIRGLTAVVTGAGHGIGERIAIELAKKGVMVALWDIDKESIDAVARDIKEQHGLAFSYKCDVTKKEEVYETARKVELEIGHVDILVNNAGVVSGKQLLQCSDEDLKRTMDVNVMAHFWTLKAFLGPMMARNHGNIVAIASIMGLIGCPSLVDYCTSKSAVVRLMEALRLELIWKNDGVFLTTVLPSRVDTGMFDGVSGRFSWFPPTVQPDYVARKVVDAIQRDKVFVILPPWLSFAFALKPLLPQKLFVAAFEFLGFHKAMDEFTGHGKKI